MEGDAISPGDGHPCEMSWTDLDHVIRTIARQQFEMHLSWCSRHSGLTTQFGGGSRRQAQIGSHGGVMRSKPSVAGL